MTTTRTGARGPGPVSQYAIVQHSGYARTAHAEFATAVETVSVSDRLAATLRTAGGVVLDGHAAAEAYAEAANYPPGVTGLLPAARGGFHPTLAVDGLPLYLPAAGDTAGPEEEG
jgi:hypothetical protein